MHVLIYGNPESTVTDRIKEAVHGMVLRERVKEYQTLESLSNGLRRPLMGRAIAVLLPESRQDLAGLISIGDLLQDTFIILILQDRERNTISAAHTLRPRFLTFVDSNLGHVASVLEKMLDTVDFEIGWGEELSRGEDLSGHQGALRAVETEAPVEKG